MRSVHRAAIAVDLASAETLTIAIEAVGGCPTAIVVRADDLRTFGVAPGMDVLPSADGWQIPAAPLAIDRGRAPIWDAALPSSTHLTATPQLARRAVTTRSLVDALARPGGLWPRRDRRTDDAWSAAARPVIRQLGAALVTGDGDEAAASATRLVGLGIGLTPSGDDLLVGLLAGLEATRDPVRGEVAAAVTADVGGRTSAAGAAALRHAARGAYTERLQDVVAALAGPARNVTGATPRDGSDGLARAVVGCLAFGATSGSDTLAGLLLAVDGALERAANAAGAGAAA